MLLLTILLAGASVVLVSLIGVLTVQGFARSFIETRLQYLVSFSAGVFLVTALALALEVFHVIETVYVGVLLIVAGYSAAWVMHRLLPDTHHHHDATCQRSHGQRGARRLLVGDGLHNMADGIVLVPAFMVSPVLGMAVTGSIMIHETLQEISKFFVLRAAGYSVRRAIVLCVAVSSTIFLGVLLGYLLLVNAHMEGVLLAMSSGFLLHVVAHDLLPTRHRHPELKELFTQLSVVVVGVVLMVAINLLVEDVHVHGGDGHGQHEHSHADELHHDGEHDHGHEPHEDHGHSHAENDEHDLHAHDTDTHENEHGHSDQHHDE